MLGNSPYYRQSISRYAAAFMGLFSDISIQKVSSDGSTATVVHVPIAYGPRQKWLGLLQGNPDLNRPVAITLPRIGVEMVGMTYASDRKLNSTNQYIANYALANNVVSANVAYGDPSSVSFVYVQVPMDITWRLDIMTNSTDDANQIMEQIIPFFTPEWVVRMRLVDELGIEFNVPVIFRSASLTDTYSDGNNNERRIMIWSLGFDMKASFVGPPQTSKIIKISKADIYVSNSTNWTVEANVSPGMLANGQPTSNQSLSVNPLTITANDDFGYVVQIIDNTDS